MPRLSSSERSRDFRANFAATHGGVSFNAAGRLARALGLKSGARAHAVRLAASSAKGAELLGYDGPDLKRQFLRDQAAKAADWEARKFQAVWDVVNNRKALAEAERRHNLPAGTLRRSFTKDELAGGTDQAILLRAVTVDGPRFVVARDQADREIVAAHLRAVQLALQGHPAALRHFEGVQVGGYDLATDLRHLRAWHQAGLLDGGPYPELRGAA